MILSCVSMIIIAQVRNCNSVTSILLAVPPHGFSILPHSSAPEKGNKGEKERVREREIREREREH